MRNLTTILFSTVILLLSSACSRHAEVTKAKIQVSLSNLIDQNLFQGGALIMGHNRETDEGFAYIPNGNDDTLTLTNGTWDFMAIAWEGDSNETYKAMTGTHRCEVLQNIDLGGGEITLNFITSTEKCTQTMFAEQFNNNQLYDFKFKSCNKLPETLPNIDDCSSTDSNEGTIRSVRITLEGGTGSANLVVPNTQLTSKCISNFTSSGVFVPTGVQDIGMNTILEYFDNDTCSVNTATRHVNYFRGLKNAPPFDSKLNLIENIPYFYFADTPSTYNYAPVLSIATVSNPSTDMSVNLGTTPSSISVGKNDLIYLNAFDAVTLHDFDENGDPITYNCYYDETVDGSVTNATTCSSLGVDFDSQTGQFIWVPRIAGKDFEFKVTASDGYNFTEKLFSYTTTTDTDSTASAISTYSFDWNVNAGEKGIILFVAETSGGQVASDDTSSWELTTPSDIEIISPITIAPVATGTLNFNNKSIVKVVFKSTKTGTKTLTHANSSTSLTLNPIPNISILAGPIGAIKIVTQPGGAGGDFNHPTITPDDSYLAVAAAFDIYDNYKEDVVAQWILPNSLQMSATTDMTESTNISGALIGTGKITIQYKTPDGQLFSYSSADMTTSAGAAQAVEFYVSGSNKITVGGSDSATLEAVVRDAGGNPVTGESVTFGTIPTDGGTVNQSSGTSNSEGKVPFIITSSNVAGLYDYNVSINGGSVVSVNASLEFLPTEVATIDLTSAGNDIVADGTSTTSISFIAKDTYTNVVPNATLSLNIPTNGGSAPSAITDSYGVATFTLTSSTKSGTYSYKAVKGTVESATTNVTFLPGAEDHIKITNENNEVIDTLTITAGNYRYLRANSYDKYDNLITSTTTNATWSANGGSFNTLDSYEVEFTGTTAGTVVVTATKGSLTDTTGNITVIAGPATQISLESAADGTGTDLTSSVPNQIIASTTQQFYAVLRDAYENFVGLDSSASWTLAGTNGTIDNSTGSSTTFTPTAVGTETVTATASISGNPTVTSATINISSDLVAEVNTLIDTFNNYIASEANFTSSTIGNVNIDTTTGEILDIGNFTNLLHPNFLDDGHSPNRFLGEIAKEDVGHMQINHVVAGDITVIDANDGELAYVTLHLTRDGNPVDIGQLNFKRDTADGKYKMYGNQMPFGFYMDYSIQKRYRYSAEYDQEELVIESGINLQEIDNYRVLQMYNSTLKDLDGEVSVTNGSATVTGTGTSFNSDLTTSDTIYICDTEYNINTIDSDTSLTLTASATQDCSGGISKATIVNNIRKIHLKLKDPNNLTTVFLSKEIAFNPVNPWGFQIGWDDDGDGEYCPEDRINSATSGQPCYGVSTPEGQLWQLSDSELSSITTDTVLIEYTFEDDTSTIKPYSQVSIIPKPYSQSEINAITFPKLTLSGTELTATQFCKLASTSDVTLGIDMSNMNLGHYIGTDLSINSIGELLNDNYNNQSYDQDFSLDNNNQFTYPSLNTAANDVGISDPNLDHKHFSADFQDSNKQEVKLTYECTYWGASINSNQPLLITEDGFNLVTLNFGFVPVSSSKTRTFRIKNVSNASVSGIKYALRSDIPVSLSSTCSGSAVLSDSTETTLEAGEYCDITVTFSPTSPESWGPVNYYNEEGIVFYISNNMATRVNLVGRSADCPAGYVQVAANTDVGVSNNFCVMRYEASMHDINGTGVYTPGASYFHIPWDSITASEAKTACQNLGSNYDLISNPEWMAIARELENNANNWSGGVVGSGIIPYGHSDNSPSNALLISDFSDPYDSTGDNAGESIGSGWEQKRVLTLNSGAKIWDFAGNVSEWVDWTLGGSLTTGPTNGTTGGGWTEITTLLGSLTTADLQSTSNNFDSTNGVGKLYSTDDTGTGYATRGGHYLDNDNAGIYSLYLGNTSSTTASTIGFRCVYRP